MPYKNLKKQNSNRVHKVPEKVFDKLIWKLEIPTVRAARDLAFVKEGCCSSGLFYEIRCALKSGTLSLVPNWEQKEKCHYTFEKYYSIKDLSETLTTSTALLQSPRIKIGKHFLICTNYFIAEPL